MEMAFMVAGFLLASYSIVANDAIQTLGTFLASNSKRPWWVLWMYAGGLLTAVLVWGWYVNDGDVSYGRLAKVPLPEDFSWIYVVPPVVLLLLTRLGMPVSTTFLVLTIFAPKNLGNMVLTSAIGYALAFVVAIVLYLSVLHIFERRFIQTLDRDAHPIWTVLQWCSTAFLWCQWLIQDLANIFVYLPRKLDFGWLVFCVFAMLALHAIIFYTRGGAIQQIVTAKTNTEDIRPATIIDFIYGFILLFFKEYSDIPMSTTWVFLGLLAGREIALTVHLRVRPWRDTAAIAMSDMAKALIGLLVSVFVALGLPRLASLLGT